MNISDFKTILEELVHYKLYESSKFSKEQKRSYKDMKKYMRNTNQFVEDLRTIVSTRNNENYYAYDKYIIEFITDTSLDNKLLFLNNPITISVSTKFLEQPNDTNPTFILLPHFILNCFLNSLIV